ncbi:hypothetical protein [Flammeovirga pacifica]|uniref:Uncharacterized protein n=1 Tax=Flammeovirga pacifica TaxID=915059 RepID=A0A1S1Z4Q2_FLAPC|nr:hypothetical protein [Flammeovirga pacifica]OHX68266.1 hypothetical protein NH26_18895 [Flammeovirga pacifica]
MNILKNSIFCLLLLFSSNIYALSLNHHDGKHPKHKKSNYDHLATPPKVKTAPFIKGVAADPTLEIYSDTKNHLMLVEKSSDNILFDGIIEGKDFVRVFNDERDHTTNAIIWRIKKYDKKNRKITWKKYTYKKIPNVGWRPVDNKTTIVKAFK